MSSIDNRVVKMEFQNQQFESGVSKTMSTLDKLKEKLKFGNETKSLENLESVANKTNFNPLLSAVQTVSDRFTTLGIIGVTALQNITNSAMAAGQQLLTALTIDPIKSGLSEYETQINSVQTILSNTQSKGTTIDQVNDALDELNTYADKTIYNFTEMTRNIGTFTAAGVGLDDSVQAIKGIANLAAMSGSTSAQASNAMYQLSQALAAGRVSLMDWNSVVNAGMGGEVFQNALKRTAENMGTNVDAMIEKYGSFRESLTQGGWLTADVLTETLAQLSGAYSEADLMAQGYSEEQAKEIVQLAQTAEDAATKVTTFTKLVDTLGEALQSGWTQSWETIIGDFEEARELWTNVSDVLGGYINESASARNAMLEGWADMGGRQELIDGIAKAFDNLVKIVSTVRDAFRDVFPPTTSEQLYNLTEGFHNLMENLEPSPRLLDQLGRIAKGVFSAFDILGQVVGTVASSIANFLGSDGVSGLIDMLLEGAASIGDFFTRLDQGIKSGSGLETLADALNGIFQGISDFITGVSGGIGGIGDFFSGIADGIGGFVETISGPFKTAIEWIKENVDLGTIFGAVGAYGSIAGLKQLKDIASTIKDFIDALRGGEGNESTKSIKDNITELLDGVKESIGSFVSGIKVGSLLAIAAAIGILTLSLAKLSEIPAPAVVGSLTAIGVMLGELVGTLTVLTNVVKKLDTGKLIQAGVGMVVIAEAVNILSEAVKTMSDIDFDSLGRGLLGTMVALGELVAAIDFLNGKNVTISTSIAILAIAEACKMLSTAVEGFSGMNWNDIARGLVGMGGALAEVAGAASLLGKFGGVGSIFGSIGILIAVQSLSTLSDGLKKLSQFSWEEIERGLNAMGSALFQLTIAVGILGEIGGFSSLLGGASLVVAVQALQPIADALDQLSSLSWDEIQRGLNAMSSALFVIGGLSAGLGSLAGIGMLIGSGSILIAVQALKPIADALEQISGLSWDEIQRGINGMSSALLAISGLTTAFGMVGGVGGILGSASLLIAVQSLKPIADALEQISGLSWDEIQRGINGMSSALIVVGGLSTGLGMVGGLAGILGGASILLTVQSLGDLADALAKFGSMDWDTIGRGLAAMGAAMGETALGGLLNTLSGFGAESIATIAEPLGTLADSVKKWSGVTVPEGLGTQLGELAGGVGQFTLSGFGAGALSTVAEPLGTLATSVKKWSNVTVPENIQTGLQNLATGVNAFTFSGLGAGGLSSVVEPLGNLAGAVKKWNGVTIPENIQTGLEGLAKGVNAFSLSFVAGFSIDTVIEPLKNLAGAVQAWNGISIPENLGTALEGLAKGLNSFVGFNSEGTDFSSVKTAASAISSAVSQIAAIDFSGASAALQTFVTSISAIPSQLSGLASSLSAVGTSAAMAFSASFSAGLITAGATAVASVVSIFASISSAVMGQSASITVLLMASGLAWMVGLAAGITSGMPAVTSSVTAVMKAAVQACSGYASQFNTAGRNAMAGLAAGIRAGGSGAINAARSVATRALQAAKEALDINSPSKKFEEVGMYSDQGMAQGFLKFGSTVYSAARNVSRTAMDEAQRGFNSTTIRARINPVLTGSNASLFSGSGINANLRMDGLTNDIATLGDYMTANEANMARTTRELRTSIDSLKEDVSGLGDSIKSMQWAFYVDSKDLAKATAKSMDKQLQVRSRRQRL